jgi:hypothetical protein
MIFIVVVLSGVVLARHKPLWNDEIFSQVGNIQSMSYMQIIKGDVGEGNNCPLFYLTQKLYCDVFKYRLSQIWNGGSIYDDHAQVFLRVPSIILMSLAVALVFYFLAFQGLLFAFLSTALFCTSFVVWAYIAEARPYALWIFLTVLQTIFLYKALQKKEASSRDLNRLTLVHCLLSLTSVFGTAQAVLGSFLLLMAQSVKTPVKFVGILAVPVGIGSFYLWHAPKYPFRVGNAMDLILMNVSMDRLLVLAGCVLFIACYPPWRKNLMQNAENCLILFFLGLLMMSLTLILFYYLQHVPGQQGFELASRYFVNLAPVSTLILIWMAARGLNSFLKDGWVRMNIYLMLVGLIMIESLRTYTLLMGFYQW